MAKKRSSKKSGSRSSVAAILLLLTVFIVVAVLYGPQEALQVVSEMAGVDLGYFEARTYS